MNDSKCFLRMPATMASMYKFSAYNIYLDEGMGLVYNTYSQAISSFEDFVLKEEDVPDLVENGFIVRLGTDELAEIKAEYDSRELLSNELHLIIATTLDCQFRCFYCYESHPKVYMTDDVKQAIRELAENHAMIGKNISVVWYGGEPMLDFGTIQSLSDRFIEICERHNVLYSASMISNGYAFHPENVGLLDAYRIGSIQITLDGMKEVHEMRRPLLDNTASFDQIVGNMKLIQDQSNAKVHLRINVDKSNIDSAHELLLYCSENGLSDIDVNLGMMKAFGCDHSCDPCNTNLFRMSEFSTEFLRFRYLCEKLGFTSAVEKMSPEYKINSCTMDAPNAYVIDPYGWVYKCISLVGQKERSIGNILAAFDENAHTKYSPFSSKRCMVCKYFPVCKGGCLLNNSGMSKECNVWRYITSDLILRDVINE